MMSDDKRDAKSETAKPENAAARDDDSKSAWQEKGEAAELEALKAETADLKDRLLRSMAEMENLRRRTEREKIDTGKYAVSSFAHDMLSVADNMRRAVEAVPPEALVDDAPLKALLDGVEVTERELLNVFERHGIKKIAAKGERFDPHLHQAMLEVENKEVPAGTVIDELQAGYVIEDRVLRPAFVSVAKGGAKLPRGEAAEPRAANNNVADEGDGPEDDGGGGQGGKPSGSPEGAAGGRVDKSA